jgi:hypothetical protein
MKHIKHLVSNEFADTLMEQFGYEAAPVIEEKKEVVEETEVVEDFKNFYKNDGKLYELSESVEEFEGDMYIEVSQLAEDIAVSLAEGSYTVLEAVEFDESEFTLSEDIFEDNEGTQFVKLVATQK